MLLSESRTHFKFLISPSDALRGGIPFAERICARGIAWTDCRTLPFHLRAAGLLHGSAPCALEAIPLYRAALWDPAADVVRMSGPFSATTKASVARKWAEDELDAAAATQRGLVPCVLKVNILAGTRVFFASYCRELIEYSVEHKAALLFQEEALLPSGTLRRRNAAASAGAKASSGQKRPRGPHRQTVPVLECDYEAGRPPEARPSLACGLEGGR